MRCKELLQRRASAAILVLLGSFGTMHCDSREDRVIDVCATLANCTGFLDDDSCEKQVTDALKDQRISRAGLSRCAHCLGDHESGPGREEKCPDDPTLPCENCRSLLAERDCDAACAEVDFVLRSRTSAGMRTDMCTVIDRTCGAEGEGVCESGKCGLYADESGLDIQDGAGGLPPTVPGCEDLAQKPLALEASLELDAIVEQCWACTQDVASAFSEEESRAARCTTLTATCAQVCALVRPANDVLGPAAAALALCDDCLTSPPAGDLPPDSEERDCTSAQQASSADSAEQLIEQRSLCLAAALGISE